MKIGEELGRNIRSRPPLRSGGKKQKTGLVPGYNQANPAIRIPIKGALLEWSHYEASHTDVLTGWQRGFP